MATFTAEIDVTVDEFLNELDADERKELYESLKDEFNEENEETERKDKEKALMYLRGLTPYDFKKLLVDALYLPSYLDGEDLERALKPIIDAQ